MVGYEIGRQLKVQTIFAERMNSKLVLRRDFKIEDGSNVLIVEDVITTGKSVIECSEIIETSKANLLGYACIIDRTNENVTIKDKIKSIDSEIEKKTSDAWEAAEKDDYPESKQLLNTVYYE